MQTMHLGMWVRGRRSPCACSCSVRIVCMFFSTCVLCYIFELGTIGVYSNLHRAQQIPTAEHAFTVCADRFRCGVAGDGHQAALAYVAILVGLECDPQTVPVWHYAGLVRGDKFGNAGPGLVRWVVYAQA